MIKLIKSKSSFSLVWHSLAEASQKFKVSCEEIQFGQLLLPTINSLCARKQLHVTKRTENRKQEKNKTISLTHVTLALFVCLFAYWHFDIFSSPIPSPVWTWEEGGGKIYLGGFRATFRRSPDTHRLESGFQCVQSKADGLLVTTQSFHFLHDTVFQLSATIGWTIHDFIFMWHV